jgi:hypothetical protein
VRPSFGQSAALYESYTKATTSQLSLPPSRLPCPSVGRSVAPSLAPSHPRSLAPSYAHTLPRSIPRSHTPQINNTHSHAIRVLVLTMERKCSVSHDWTELQRGLWHTIQENGRDINVSPTSLCAGSCINTVVGVAASPEQNLQHSTCMAADHAR